MARGSLLWEFLLLDCMSILEELNITYERIYMNNRSLGNLYIVLGLLLFYMVAGKWMMDVAIALFALYAINYGLILRGMSPLSFTLMRWFDQIRYR